jgi:S-adenosylmethionine hydrolase
VSAGIVTLLTDFGLRDGYVGAVKGALLSRNPRLRLVDVSHDLEPGDVTAAAWALRQSAPAFPPGCVHLVVVDPGVGGERRGLACRSGSQLFVAPDNGVLHWILGDAPIVRSLAVADSASPVFHGRDVFAPAAAALAAGAALEPLGPGVEPDSLVRLPFAPAERGGDTWRGTVVHVDRFGNAITDLELPADVRGVAEVTGRAVPLRRTYSDVADGEPVALRGSSDTLELSCNGSSAARSLGIGLGDVIVFRVD